jgi:serine/threonine-protein kinase
MARVYEGRHSQLDNRVALKVLEPVLAAQPLAAARFLREAKAAAHIRHQNVVQVFDVGVQDGVPFIVMEFLDGPDLATLMAKEKVLPLANVVELFLPVISAVETAHEAGIIHRDLKPANLLLTQRAPRGVHPVVLDFGISKIVSDDDEGRLTRSESLLGTARYMAPELTKGARFATTSSDQYAIGVMLYECATGTQPFKGESHYETMHAVVTAPVTPPSRIVPSLPTDFDAIVLRAMSRDPAKRFPSARALGTALLSFANKTTWALWEGEFVHAERATTPLGSSDSATLHDTPSRPGAPSASKQIPRWKLVRRVGLGALFAYASLLTLLALRRTPEPPPRSFTEPSQRPVSNTMGAPAPAETPLPEPSSIAASEVPSSLLRPASADIRAVQKQMNKPSRTVVAPSSTSSGASQSSSADMVRGTNGAPIVE